MKSILGVAIFIALMLLMDVIDRHVPTPPAPQSTYSAAVCAHYNTIGQGWKCQ